MLQRFFYGFIAISAVLCIVVLDWFLATDPASAGALGGLVRRGTLIPILFAALIFGGGLEMLRLMRSAGLHPHGFIAISMSLVLLLSPWFSAAGLLGDGPSDTEGLKWQLIWMALAVIATAIAQLRRGTTDRAIEDVGATLLAIVYLGLLPSFAIQLRCCESTPAGQGAWLIVAFLTVTKASDIGAYLIGSAIGRHKLLPTVSPGKSIEGALGGVLASVLVAVGLRQIYYFYGPELPNGSTVLIAIEQTTRIFRSLDLWQAIVFGVLMSVFGQVGDLFESAIKRAAGKKDSASLVPSFGGLLDLIDSPVFAAPVAWFVLTVWWGVV